MITPNFILKTEKETPDFGVFIIEPLQKGYGQTLGNTLRRVLLSSLPGAAIVQVKIAGVKHIFSTLKGLTEDIVELALNLKRVRIRYQADKPVKISLDAFGPGEVLAGDLEVPAGVEIINKDLILGHLADKSSRLKADFVVEAGYGYVPFEEKEVSEIGIIPIDAIFTPVQRVNYSVSATRVGRVTDFDKLTIEIYTDGTISPKEALIQSAQTAAAFFKQIYEPTNIVSEEVFEEKPKEDLTLMVEELELPTRIVNALLREDIKTVNDLKNAGKKRISKIKNLGGKSIGVIEEVLSQKGIVLEE